jgi:hypothetical protein
MTSKQIVLALVPFALGIAAALLCGMAVPRADSLVARELKIVDAQGRTRIYLRVNDQGTAGISLYHPNGESLISILADEDGASVSMATSDGKPRARLRTDSHGTPSLDFFDAKGERIEGAPASPERKAEPKKAAEAPVLRGPSWVRMNPGVYKDEAGEIAVYATGLGATEEHSMSFQRTKALNAARQELASVVMSHVQSTFIPTLLSAASERHPLGDAKSAIACDEELARSLTSWFIREAQQIDSYFDEKDQNLWVLLRLDLDDKAIAGFLEGATPLIREAMKARSIDPARELTDDLQNAAIDVVAAMKKAALPMPVDPNKGKGSIVRPRK